MGFRSRPITKFETLSLQTRFSTAISEKKRSEKKNVEKDRERESVFVWERERQAERETEID